MWLEKKKCLLPTLTITGFILMSGCTDSISTANKLLQQIQQGQTEIVERNFDPAQITRGRAIFRENCAVCHGPNAEATPNWRKPLENGRYPPPPLDGTAHAWHHSTEELKRFILKGGPPGEGRMPGWEGKLTEQEIEDILVWIKSLWPDEVYDAWYKRIEHRE
ncbi:Cytochrome C oxidase, cbb3-type, subunit III [Nitrosomonas communis]|jgi:mono/diheme cytochrome c family protein|uniref:Cytochrome C oxidase, cbb3-type, subunit III n=2 Tax=Nitrosomonas communis TaxID=44574 RepID=A0A1H2R8W5_9PROT|nr:Cytochrome C oxidase, cbb3-type, subunit III [Nitrosomonas communis]